MLYNKSVEQLRTWLSDYGMNQTEIEVYLCILESPGIRVADIQRQTSLGRTTIYYCLAQLKSDGLLSENLQNNVKTYRATTPEHLRRSIELNIGEEQRKLDALTVLKPVFDTLPSKKPDGETYIARFEGVKAVKLAIEEAFRCESKHWHVIASRDNFLYHTSKQYQQYYLSERKRRNIISKTLWEPTDSFSKLSLEDTFYRNPRKLPHEFLGAFTSLVILYDDVTLVVDPYKQKTAYAIHDSTSTQLLRLMLELIWKNARQA